MELKNKISIDEYHETLNKIKSSEVKTIFTDNYAPIDNHYCLYEYITKNDKSLLENYKICEDDNNNSSQTGLIRNKLTKFDYNIIMLKCSKSQKEIVAEIYSKKNNEYVLNVKEECLSDYSLYELKLVFEKLNKYNINSEESLQNFKSSECIKIATLILFILSFFIFSYPLAIIVIIFSIILVTKGNTASGVFYIIFSVINIYLTYVLVNAYANASLFKYLRTEYFYYFF